MTERDIRQASPDDPIAEVQGPPSYALIDFASICPRARSDADDVDALELVGELIREVVVGQFPYDRARVREIQCRLYGGWWGRTGIPTEQRAWVLRNLRQLRTLRYGIRTVPTIVDAMLCAPDAVLWGTYKNKQQKMVDQMLAQDAALLVAQEDVSLILVSDDDDFTPVLLALAQRTTMCMHWLRQRDAGDNDRHFLGSSVSMTKSEAWQ
jgi:hypothetical protein